MNVNEIQSKYDESFNFLQARKKRQVQQLVLLNNLRKGDENIASTLLITLFNRILSNLYDDKMQVQFVPGEAIDQRRIQNFNVLAKNDYREMNKDRLDYDWNWDTLFFGRGYMETLRFDKKRRLMQPEVINPLVFGYDPYFENVEDWRYYWKWVTKNKHQINKLIKDGTITGIKDADELPSGVDPYLWDYKVKREQAKEATPVSNDASFNDVYQILEFFTYDENGNKCVYWTDKNFSKVLMKEKLDLRDGPDGKSSRWPIVIKEAFREPHSTVTFSVADLLDDKHRARSVLLNLAFIAAKDTANPLYVYNPDKVQDVTQLFSRQINQHIPATDIEGAIMPLNRQEPISPGLAAFMQVLSQEANDPVGTGMALTPNKKGQQSATEAAIQQQLNDLAQSLQSKVMQFGEKDFWMAWWQRYKRYTKPGDSKVAAVTGVRGAEFLDIDLGDIHTDYPPGVLIYSAKEAEYKRLVLRRDYMQMYPALTQSLSPDGLRNFNKYQFFPLFVDDPTSIDIFMPKTTDEIRAEQENDKLDNDILVEVAETDNHEQHIITHYQAKKTWATWHHIAWHEELLAQQKSAEMQGAQQMGGPMQPGGQEQAQEQPGQPGQGVPNFGGLAQPKTNTDGQSNTSAATALKGQINYQDNVKQPKV